MVIYWISISGGDELPSEFIVNLSSSQYSLQRLSPGLERGGFALDAARATPD